MRLTVAVDLCDLCGRNRFSPEMTVGGRHLLRYESCGLMLTSPRYTSETIKKLCKDEYYQKAADYYMAQLSRPPTGDFDLAAAAGKALGKKGGQSLDVGCEPGAWSKHFSDRVSKRLA